MDTTLDIAFASSPPAFPSDWRVFVGAVCFCGGWKGQLMLSSRSGCKPVELPCDRSRTNEPDAIADAQASARRFAERVAARVERRDDRRPAG